MRDLESTEIKIVAGGSIVQELMERFPFGEWDGSTFWPNGKPQPTEMPDVTT